MVLRKLYQRVISLPIDSLEKEWREYETFEISLSEHLAKNKFIPENLPRYQAAKAVLKERKSVSSVVADAAPLFLVLLFFFTHSYLTSNLDMGRN